MDSILEPWTMLGNIAARNRIARLRLALSITPAVGLFVVTGRTRDDVDEAFESKILQSFGLTCSDEMFVRHGAQHPLGAGFAGSQDLLPHDIDEQTALSYGYMVLLNFSFMQRSLRKGLASALPFTKIISGIKKL
jgi:phthiodiolone/phenolphthiodiolone dimycocerosates ketoreductase